MHDLMQELMEFIKSLTCEAGSSTGMTWVWVAVGDRSAATAVLDESMAVESRELASVKFLAVLANDVSSLDSIAFILEIKVKRLTDPALLCKMWR